MYKIIEDNVEFIVVSKSTGVDFHDDKGVIGLASMVKKDLQLTQLFPVHRLDKITSGLIVFAKTIEIARLLGEKFEKGGIEKYYMALSKGKPSKKQGLIKGDMERGRRSGWKLLKSYANPAITQFFSFSIFAGHRLYILKPSTGRTHQLRVALKSIGVPIVGDTLYNKKDTLVDEADRCYLHSYVLGFTLNTNEYRFIDYPDTGKYFDEKILSGLESQVRSPWDLNWPKI